jgi:hypothetical protein
LNFLTGSETYADNGPVLSDFELFSEELDETGNPKKITPREFLEGKSSYAVPYEAIEAITEPSNYLPSGFYKDENALYANLDLHRDGSITFDMGEVIVDTSSPETFDSYGFSSDVKEILPTRIIVNFSSESKPKETPVPPAPRNPEVILDNTSLMEKVASIEGIDVETVADLLRAKFGFVNTEEAKKYLERIIKMHEEMARLKDKPDEDDFNRAVTVFADTTPGSLQTIEWAKTVLQKILPGIDIDKQVEFLDNLQMSVFENPEDNILGRVSNAILKLKIDENKLVYDEVVYHEAFHMAYRYLFSESTRTRLKATFRELYGQEFTDRQVTEGLAELYQRYEERASIKKGWLRKLLEDLRAFFDTVFKNRLYLERTFFNLDEGKYSAIITSKTKEGAPDNMQFVKTNFGTRGNYIHAVRTIKERIVQYLQHGTLASEDLDISLMNLPMNRKEIFDAIYDEFVQKHVFFEEQKEDKHAQILKHYNVKSLEHLSRKIRENQSVLDKGTLDIDEKEFLMEQTLDMHKALKEFEALSNLVTLYNTITNVNKKTGKYIFFEIIENLYPSYKSEENYKFELDTLTEEEVQGFTDADREALNVSEDADANSILEAFEGLRAETIDHAKVNWASKQSLSLKDFFSFIPLLVENSIIPEQKDGVLVTINSKVAYVRALQLLLKLNLNTSNINEEIAYLEKHEDLNRWDRSILHKLQEIFGKISDIAETRPPYTIVAEAFPLKSDVNYYFFADLAGTTDANSLSFEAAKALHISDPNRYKLVTSSNNSLIELYHQAAEILPISQETFKDLYEQREALNTIANIQSFMGSLKDTEYKHSVKSVRGKSRFLSMVTNRGNDYQVNNKALIKEAFRKNLDSSKSLLKDEQAVTLLANKLKSENVKEQSSAIRSLLEKLELTKDFKVINQHKLRQNRIAISEFLTTLTSSSSFPTITVSTETAEGDLKYDVDSWLIQNNSALNALAKVVAKEEQQPKTTSIISVKKQKIYKHTLTNPIYKFGNKVINYQERIIRGVKEDSGLAVLPKALELVKELNPFLIQTKNNRFLMRMHSLFELDGHKDRYGITEYANDVLSFDKKRLHTTLFSSGFLNNLISGTYEQLFYQQADKPRPIGAVVDLLSENQLDDILPYLEKNAKYFLDKDRAAFFKMHNKKYNSTNVVNGKLIGKALESTEGFSEAFKKLVAKEAIKLAKDLVAAKTDTVGSPAQVKALENKFNAQELLSLLNEALSEANMSPISGIQQLAVKSSDKGNYQNTVEMFVPYAYAYLMNHYVNSYFMNQLVAGSSQFYGDAKTVLKRMTGAAGPGHGMWINERFGTKSKFKAIVIGDPTTSKEEIFNQVLSALNKEHSEEELTALKNFFGLADLERTDGQVFLTPTRLQNLQKGLGREFRLSNIIKPKFFGPRIEKNNVTGEEFAIPTYIKPSGVVLSDELLYEPGTKTPRKGMSGLAAIREKMDKHGIDELVFASAVKAGLPAERHTLEEFMKSDQPIKGILELENEHYQIQLNPRAKVDSSAALFTQLSYFLNIYSSSKDKNNVAKAETVYSAIAFLFEKGGKLFGRDVATPEKFKNLLMRAFSENGDELIFADLIESGIAPNSPIFEKKAMIKLASMMEKLATKIRLPGGKLVLQSDVTVLNPHTGKPLKFLNDNGKLVAEVIVPRGLFSEEVARQIEAGIIRLKTQCY